MNFSIFQILFLKKIFQKKNLKNTEIHEGRISGKGLKKILGKNFEIESEFFVCGPPGFTKCVLKMLEEEMNVPKGQIRFEYFGPQLQ